MPPHGIPLKVLGCEVIVWRELGFLYRTNNLGELRYWQEYFENFLEDKDPHCHLFPIKKFHPQC